MTGSPISTPSTPPSPPFGRPILTTSPTTANPAQVVSPSGRSVETPRDAQLLSDIRRGDELAAQVLYERYARRLQAFARRRTPGDLRPIFESADLVQDVFGSFFRRASEGHYRIPDGLELWSLLAGIALNKVRDAARHHHRDRRDRRRDQSLDAEPIDLAAVEEDDRLLRILLDDFLDGLHEDHRKFVELRIDGHGIDDIAARTGRAKRSIERVLQNIRDDLRRLLNP